MRHRLVVFSQGTLELDRARAEALRPSGFVIEVRAAGEDDWRRADQAAARGRAGGMDLLARRCLVVWRVASDEPERAVWELALRLAGELLGPVMPDDESTLVGVRGARLRVEAAVG